VPVTGQNPVPHSAFVEGESHVWAAVVYSEDIFAVFVEGEGVSVCSDCVTTGLVKIGKGGNFYDMGRHGTLLRINLNTSFILYLIVQDRVSD
jgi:hypothetical protein